MFVASQFEGTGWNCTEDKAEFANNFVLFVERGFSQDLFTQKFYERLSNCFGHIAHHDRLGFWSKFFTTDENKVCFIEICAKHPCLGEPKCTYSDVESALVQWIENNEILEKTQHAARTAREKSERVLLLQLLQKYGVPEAYNVWQGNVREP